MFVDCPNCKKKFEVQDNLIPDKGRLLQCGNCNHKWFFIKNDSLEKNIEDNNIVKTKVKEFDIQNNKKEIKKNIKIKKEILSENIEYNEIESKKNNYFKILLAFIISFIALIILLDTFKIQISLIYPNIENILNTLYETLKDINLFLKDLIS